MTSIGFIFAQASGQQGGGFMAFMPMIVILLIAYLLILRPQMKRQKDHQKMLSDIQKGEKIVTTGGIHCEVTKVNEKNNTLTVRITGDLKVVIDRNAVGRKLSTDVEAVKPK